MLNKKKLNKDYEFLTWWVEESKLPTPGTISRGWGNGYAIVPREHPFNGLTTSEIYDTGKINDIDSEITLSDMRYAPNGKEYWVLGFDTAHYGDNIVKWPKERVEEAAKKLALLIKLDK
jgi:hypothetical protein